MEVAWIPACRAPGGAGGDARVWAGPGIFLRRRILRAAAVFRAAYVGIELIAQSGINGKALDIVACPVVGADMEPSQPVSGIWKALPRLNCSYVPMRLVVILPL